MAGDPFELGRRDVGRGCSIDSGGNVATYKVGQKVVYPSHGVGSVQKIEKTTLDGVEETFYYLTLFANESTVMVPKQNLDLVGLRKLCTRKQIKELLALLEDGKIDTYKDWKGRYKQNLDKMKTGDLTEVASVLKNLRLVSTKKSLSFREKKMYERAKYFIVSEIEHVNRIAEATAETKVEDALEKTLKKHSRKKSKD